MSEASSPRWLDRPALALLSTKLRSSPAVLEHALLSLLFLLGRWLLDLAGLRFNFVRDWMFLADPADLRDRLLETVYYSHAYPPGLNLLTGWLLKVGEPRVLNAAHALYQLLGLVFVNSLFYLYRSIGLSALSALVVTTAFSLIPQVIYFEHLHLYTYPTAALLCASAALFQAAVGRPSFTRWLWFFLVCAAIGWLRSIFHLVWFVAMLALALLFSPRKSRPKVLAAAAGPGALLLGLYLKNLILFGVFGALTAGPVALTTATIKRLSQDERQAWVREGKVSPFAAIHPYAGPEAYLPYFASSQNPRWPPLLNRLDRPTVGQPNYNHWFFLSVNPRRRQDALTYVKARPGDYARTVVKNTGQFFSATSRWHPADASGGSPHQRQRQVLGGYERRYNAVVHELVFAPVGLYLLLAAALFWFIYLAARRRLLAGQLPHDPWTRMLAFSWLQILFVTVTCILTCYGEAPRFRFNIEAFIWLVGGLVAVKLRRSQRDRMPSNVSRNVSMPGGAASAGGRRPSL